MANVNPASAVAAYSSTARAAMPAPSGMTEQTLPGPSFSNLVEQVAENALQAGKASEVMSMKAVTGTAEMTDVVTAVANAEVTLQTVVAVRDRVVQAYQDIMRMPM